jgi:cytochrome c biogenesis protein CcmG/thiol:disulfide interchange protein DsbE
MPSSKKRREMAHERRRNQLRVAGIAVGVVVVLAVAAVVLSGGSAADVAGETRPVTVNGVALAAFPTDGAADPAAGRPAPTLVGQSFDGSAVTIDPMSSGRPTATWFVAHWCPHCNAEVPRIVSLQQQGALPAGVDVYAVSTGVNPAAPNYPPSTWFQSDGWPFPVLADDDQQTAAKAYGLPSYPYLVVVGADGAVIARHAGELGTDGIVQALRAATG